MDRFFQVPNEIFETNLTIYQKITLAYLYRAGNNDKPIFPSYATISEKCSMSRTKALNTIRELEKLGILLVKRRYKGRCQNMSNIYYINRQAIPAPKAADDSNCPEGPDAEDALPWPQGGLPLSQGGLPLSQGGLPGTQDILPGIQHVLPGTQDIPGVVNSVYPINNQYINNQYKETDINKNSLGSAAAAEPCGCSRSTLSFNEYIQQFGDSIDPEIIKAMKYFIACKESAHCEHKRMTIESWNKAANDVLIVSTFQGNELSDPLPCEWDEFTALVERYFKKQFAPGCDYSLPHFNSPNLKAILFHEAVY